MPGLRAREITREVRRLGACLDHTVRSRKLTTRAFGPGARVRMRRSSCSQRALRDGVGSTTRMRLNGSAWRSTGSRSLSNSPPRSCACSRRRGSPTGSTTSSRSLLAAVEPRPSASAPSERHSTGATTSSTKTSGSCSDAWESSPEALPKMRLSTSSPTTRSPALESSTSSNSSSNARS